MKLREYQITAKNEIRNNFSGGHRRVVLCSPTGSGKTVTFASIASDAVRSGSTVVVIVDRKELLNQSREKLIEYGLWPSLITSGKSTHQSSSYIATIETLVRRPKVLNQLSSTKKLLLIIDECHKQSFDKIFDINSLKHAFVIGASATPTRHGKQTPLSLFYQSIVQPVTINSLITSGHLVPAITFGVNFDTSKIAVKAGEFDSSSMFEKFNSPTLYSGVVEKWNKHTPNTQTICFCVNVQHSINTRDAFRSAGIHAEHIDGTTPENLRQSIIEGFKNGLFFVLCNCEILTTGFDCPTIETVIVNRATKSPNLWLQMCGRGSRPSPNKDNFNILDFGGNVFRLGFWETESIYSLHHKQPTGTGETPIKTCPVCESLVSLSTMLCPKCQFVFPKTEKKLIDADFVPLSNQNLIPDHLKNKSFNDMSLTELEQYRELKKYKIGWIVRIISQRTDVTLSEYANLKGYKKGWIEHISSH